MYKPIVFNQILQAIPRTLFKKIVTKHKGDKWCKKFTCYDVLVTQLFHQLSGRKSLRDTTLNLEHHDSLTYHLGLKSVSRSTLSDANTSRPCTVFEELASTLMHHEMSAFTKQSDMYDLIRLIDSTTISLNKARFDWASFRKHKSGVKVHFAYDPVSELPTFFEVSHAKVNDMPGITNMSFTEATTYVCDRAYNKRSWWQEIHNANAFFVTRLKKNDNYKAYAKNPVNKKQGILADEFIDLQDKNIPTLLRCITYHCPITQKTFRFITNILDKDASYIAALYKKRWQIELFFKWIKQNLKIKSFLGTSKNAVKIQVCVALIAYLIMVKWKRQTDSKRPILEIIRLVQTNLMHRKPLAEILHKKTKPPPKALPLGLFDYFSLAV